MMGNRLGKFIVIEGQGFSGKTEQAARLASRLRKMGIEVVETQEPGGAPSAIAVREELLDRRAKGNISPKEEVELFYKSRRFFLTEVVKPQIGRGGYVVSSRFSASTMVYQGCEGGVDEKFITQLDKRVVGKIQPDMYLLLDVPEEEIINRLNKSGRMRHGYNEIDLKKISGRRKAYLRLAGMNWNAPWKVVDGKGQIEEVEEKIWNLVVEDVIRPKR